MEQIHSNEGQSMDISSWMRVITFDIIGDIGFSQHWGAVKEGKLKSSVQFEAVLLTFGRCGCKYFSLFRYLIWGRQL